MNGVPVVKVDGTIEKDETMLAVVAELCFA